MTDRCVRLGNTRFGQVTHAPPCSALTCARCCATSAARGGRAYPVPPRSARPRPKYVCFRLSGCCSASAPKLRPGLCAKSKCVQTSWAGTMHNQNPTHKPCVEVAFIRRLRALSQNLTGGFITSKARLLNDTGCLHLDSHGPPPSRRVDTASGLSELHPFLPSSEVLAMRNSGLRPPNKDQKTICSVK